MAGIQISHECRRTCVRVFIDALCMSHFIHLSSKALWVSELLHHPAAAMACFAAESWPASARVSSIHFYCAHARARMHSTFLLCSVSYSGSQSVLQSDCITSPCISNTVPALFTPPAPFLLRDENHKSGADKHMHNTFIFRAVVHGSSWNGSTVCVWSNVQTHSSCRRKGSWIQGKRWTGGIDGPSEKQESRCLLGPLPNLTSAVNKWAVGVDD